MSRKVALVVALSVALLSAPAFAQDRVSASEKGSIFIFPKVELRWDSAGNLIQDTFLDLTNDYPDDVQVQMYFVNGDTWNSVDVAIPLTGNQPIYWSAATGNPVGVQPFTILEPGNPPGHPDPSGDGTYVLRGFIVGWAVDNVLAEINWNHLKGDALIVNYLDGSAWEYNAYTYQALSGSHGAETDGTPGQLLMDGVEYDQNFSLLLLDFYAEGSTALSGGGRVVEIATDLTLLPLGIDFRQDGDGPLTTKAKFDVWNMNEFKLSGVERCITCWDQELLGNYDDPNNFLRGNLQTDKGKARIDGIASSVVCDDVEAGIISVDAPLLAVAMKWLNFDAGLDYGQAGTNVVGMGVDDTAVILWDVPTEPVPTAGDIGGVVEEGNVRELAPRR